jgi:hypothetical protein
MAEGLELKIPWLRLSRARIPPPHQISGSKEVVFTLILPG